MQGRHRRVGAAFGYLLLGLSACSKHAADSQDQLAATPAGPPAGSTLSIAGQFVSGRNPASIRSYLQTVKEIKPTRFEVTWSPDVVPVSRDEAIRSLRAISEDGQMFSFASSEPVVAKLKHGSILWIYDIALCRVDVVGTDGDTTYVYTKPVPLTEAFTSADIAFDSPLNPGDYYAGYRPHRPRSAPPGATSVPRSSSPFLRVAYQPPGDAPPNDGAPADSAGEDALALDDYGIGAATQDGYTGKLAGFEYSLTYLANSDKLSFEMEARKEEEGLSQGANNELKRDQRNEYFALIAEERADQKEADEAQKEMKSLYSRPDVSHAELELFKTRYRQAMEDLDKAQAKATALFVAGALGKKVFYIASDNVDIRFRAKVDLDKFAIAGAVKLKDGDISSAMTQFKSLNGKLEFEFIGRVGQPGSGAVNIPVMHVPVVFNMPLPIDGIPFVVQLAADALVKVFLSGNHATHNFKGNYTLSGSGGFTSTPAATNTDTQIEMKEPQVEETTALSPGTSGAVVAVQLPRLGFGLGFLGASSLAFIDVVNVMTITNAAAVATLNPPCKRFTWSMTGHVGVETRVMPLPFPLIETAVSKALSQKKEVWSHEWKKVDPPIKMCEIT